MSNSILGAKEIEGPMTDLLKKLGGPNGREWLGDLKRFLRKEKIFATMDFSLLLADWEIYYREIHGLKADFSGVAIPKAADEFSWLICRPENFFAEQAYSGSKQGRARWKWTDRSLDDVLDMSFGRDGKSEPYIVRVRPNWEADEDRKGLSANRIAAMGINTLCLTERLLLGDFLYWKYQRNIDIESSTLCADSRYSSILVPSIRWDGGVSVRRQEVDETRELLCSRQAAS